MELEQKIAEWKLLKKSKKTIEKRIQELRSDITSLPLELTQKYGVTIQERDLTGYSDDRVFHLMSQKGISYDMFTRLVIDNSKLEQLYYEGTLTDSDLRYIREPKYVYALIETEVEQDVQG